MSLTFNNVHEMWRAISSLGGTVGEIQREKAILEAKLQGEEHERKAKTLIVLEIHPSSENEDLNALATAIKGLQHIGIQNWGEEVKVEELAFGIKKLLMSVTVFNVEVGVDDLFDMIKKKFNQRIKSIDVQAMSKV
uniref:Translation elongation factor EF1B beta/delta subunit guanine nucleotide exchange domain-containing protein n=1 Tax=Prorocentrum micans TaxID=2945 RepID=A0A7S2X3Z8_PROMC|mmetsp:Transcript_13453/g.16714  ORF Transcript_13453/g.16714 Transcript_13453/m.16714 type:complete len:136 (-) Transcript_13453:1783-2190(-)